MEPYMSLRLSFIKPTLILGLAYAGLCSCNNGYIHIVSYAYGYGTTWEIHLYQGSQSDADEIVSYVGKTSQLLDLDASAVPNGVYALNHNASVEADPFVIEAFELSLTLASETSGAFSYTIGKLTKAWAEALEQKTVLDESRKNELAEEARKTFLSKNGNTLTRLGDGWIDFGAIGKGLCLKHIDSLLKKKGISQYLINGGSSSLLIGESPAGDGSVKVYLEDAKNRYFSAKNCAISASSVTRQGVDVEGITYSHIVDPRTGNAALNEDALYLRGSDPAYLDGLSTAYLVLGKDASRDLDAKGIQYAYCKGGEVIHASPDFIQ